jgi:multidrug resistance efflux pump
MLRKRPMKIVRERPSDKRYHQVTAPLVVELPWGERKIANQWSLGGLLLEGLSGELPQEGATLTVKPELPFQGFDISFEVNATVTKADPDTGMLGVEFLELTERAHDLLVHFIDDLVRGKMATVDDTICRIDVPLTPISTKPDPEPADTGPRRWPIKTILAYVFYIVFGIGVFSYLGILIFSLTMRLEVQSAVVSAPVSNIKMPVDGKVVPVRLENGLMVRRGEVIARIENVKLEADVYEKRIALPEARDSLARADEKFRIQTSRMKLYKVVKKTDRQIALAEVETAKEALSAADNAFERASKLRAKGLVNADKFDQAKKTQAESEARLKKAEYELERASTLDAVSDRVFFNNKEFVADLDMLALDVDEASARVTKAYAGLEQAEKAITRLVIEAPFDGRIKSVLQPGNVNLVRNDTLLTIEKTGSPTVLAYLTQDEVLSVGLNDRAKVFIPGVGRHVQATVTKVDRTSGFIDPKASRYEWNDRTERTALVSLRLDPEDQSRDEISAGLPAVVIFPKRFTSDVYNKLGTGIGNVLGGGDAEINSI